MSKRILSILLLSGALALSAAAQSASGGDRPKAAPVADRTRSTDTNQNNAHGGISDTRPTGEGADACGSTAMAVPFVSVDASATWRASDLQGRPVYDVQGQSIGSISDVLVSQDGSINAVILGVGGFLGIGQKDVAVDMKALQFEPGDRENSAPAPQVSGETTASTQSGTAAPPNGNNKGGATATMGGGPAGAARPGAPAGSNETETDPRNKADIADGGLPDRIVLDVTRDDLANAPAFTGTRAAKR